MRQSIGAIRCAIYGVLHYRGTGSGAEWSLRSLDVCGIRCFALYKVRIRGAFFSHLIGPIDCRLDLESRRINIHLTHTLYLYNGMLQKSGD